MAIDLTSKDIVSFGDRANKKQMIFLIPAEATADKPGILVLGNVDGSGTVGNGGCIWFDNTGAPHADVTIPTDEDAAGSLVMLDTGAANVLTFTKGTSTINLAAGADITLAAGGQLGIGAAGNFDVGTGAVAFQGTAAFDQATGTVVDINANLTVSGAATVDQDLSASGTPTWTSIVTCSAGVKTKVAVTDIAAAPTQAEMVTAFGTAAAAGAGFIGMIDDAAAGVNEYVCISNGTNWYYLAVATKGA